MEQLPTIRIPGAVTPQLVVATHLGKTKTTVYILDPPEDDLGGMRPSREVEKRSARDYVVSDEVAFRTKLSRGTNLQSLRWISQHLTAAHLESSVGYREPSRPAELPNAQLTTVETEVAAFVGVETPLAPEFGFNGPTLFRGIERTHYARLSEGDIEAQPEFQGAALVDPTISVGDDGVCLLIRNLPY
jgi:hypothetical protein